MRPCDAHPIRNRASGQRVAPARQLLPGPSYQAILATVWNIQPEVTEGGVTSDASGHIPLVDPALGRTTLGFALAQSCDNVLAALVTHVAPLGDEDHLLGDVAGVVADALQGLDGEDQIDDLRQQGGVLNDK